MSNPAMVQSNSQITTVPQVFALVGDDVVSRWEKLGEIDSKTHWAYGAEAESLIAEGVPAMLVYKAIAIKAGKRSETIRQAYYTFRAYTQAEREKYAAAPYSVFRHAKDTDDKIAALEHYVSNRASVDEVETVYPARDEEDAEADREFRTYDLPRMFFGIYREIYGAAPGVVKKVVSYLRVLKRIIDEVNNGISSDKKPF